MAMGPEVDRLAAYIYPSSANIEASLPILELGRKTSTSLRALKLGWIFFFFFSQEGERLWGRESPDG